MLVALSAAAATYTSVDMGLSVRWATCNVGATSTANAGDRYAWGAIESGATYSWATYRFGSSYNAMTKYCTNSDFGKVDNLTTLEAADDAATQNWGNAWRTPTQAEWEELRTKCTWEWTDNYNSTNIKGYTVTASNGNAIFLPTTGLSDGDAVYQAGEGYYWSSSLSQTPSNACYMQLTSKEFVQGNNPRYFGQAVRPVQDIYAITIQTSAHGSLSADKTQAVGGETVTLQVHSEAYYVLRKLYVMQGETEVPTAAVAQTTNQYTFVMPVGAVTVTAEFQHIVPNFKPAPFTVNSEGKQVYFAPGNLQCTGLTRDTVWLFAEYQTDMLGTDNIRDNALADTIDLFAWSSNYTTAPWGIGTSSSSDDYEGDFVDWGQNDIGTFEPNTYRTPSLDEWQYMLLRRKNAEERVAVARINLNTDGTQYANGLILLPDNWTCPTDVSFKTGFLETTAGSIYGYANYQTLTLSDWQKLEAAGAVFLPAAGERDGTNVMSEQIFGDYWLSNIKDVVYAYCLHFYAGKADVYYNYHRLGQAVRLVQDVKYAIMLIDDDDEHGFLDSNIKQGATGEKVTLTIIPDMGYQLDQLTVIDANHQEIAVVAAQNQESSTAAKYTFTMPASAVTVWALFKKVNYTITISNDILNGKIRVATEATTAKYGDEVQLVVTPDMGYQLDRLTVTDAKGQEIAVVAAQNQESSTAANYTFTMPASAVTVWALFKKVNYTITISNDILNGEVDVATEATTAQYGDEVQLVVVPDMGYQLDQLTVTYGDGQSIAITDDYTFTMPASAVTVWVLFKKVNYRITISNDILNGEIRVATGVTTAQYGDEVQLVVTPDWGYQLDRLTVTDAEENEIETKYERFTMPASNVTITASFVPETPTALQGTEMPEIRIEGGRVVCDGAFRIYDLLGRNVTRLNGSLNGVYIVQVGATVQKIVLFSAQ